MAKSEKKTKEEMKEVKISKNKKKEEKTGMLTRFKTFCHGVKSEFKKVHWPSKKDMVKYSIATIVFVIFCSLFFYLIDIIFAFIHSLFN